MIQVTNVGGLFGSSRSGGVQLLPLLLLLLLSCKTVMAWNEGSGEVLKVHVVPHSHNDPGWWSTFEGYYQEWTKGIISSIVQVLSEDENRKFIWAEISYFQRWWEDAIPSVKDTVKTLVKNGQLEFVTAGWVMNDEANCHMVDIINQLTEGHEWLYNTLGTKPTIGWAIDPFGHSPSMAYILQEMGFDAMVINRAHREIKHDFRERRHLEFIWSGDNLNSSASFEMLAHMFPWKLYDIPNTCGPDWNLCAEFDFERDEPRFSPRAVIITPSNVKDRSEKLVGMYKEKAKLFRHNSVLVPLGDDFKYKTADMTRKIMTQYEMLFKYINQDKSLGVEIKFSTLSEYFADILPFIENDKEKKTEGGAVSRRDGKQESLFPTYQGDFFTYCDENEDYWSGYFTTRPFMKGLTRSTQAILRTGEILATLASVQVGESVSTESWNKWFGAIESARRNVGLFQHHDGVTGTARRHVVQDYADRLLKSLADLAEQASNMALVILSHSTGEGADGAKKADAPSAQKLSWTTEPAKQITHGIPHILKVADGKEAAVVIVFNSLANSRTEVVSVLVDTHEVRVTDSDGEAVSAQVDPVWEGGGTRKLSASQFTLHFVAKVSGLGLATYFIQAAPSSSSKGGTGVGGSAVLANVEEYASTSASSAEQIKDDWHFDRKPLSKDSPLLIKNSQYTIELTGFGAIKTIVRRDDKKNNVAVSAEQNFLSYSTFNSGAYLFLPNGPAQPLNSQPTSVRVFTGPIVSTVHTVTDTSVQERVVRLFECSPNSNSNNKNVQSVCPQSQAIEILHTIDLSDGNKEIITRFNTNISNSGYFYTDSNGFDMRERKYNKMLPIQGNYYPIAASTYLETYRPTESAQARLTVLSHQAHGVGSLNEGEIEIMLDRRLNKDDGRGLGEAILDNVRTVIPLWVVVELGPGYQPFHHPTISATASDVWHTFNYPLHSMHTSMSITETPNGAAAGAGTAAALHTRWGLNHHLTVEPLAIPFPSHLQLLTLAPRDQDSDDIIFRVYYPPVSVAQAAGKTSSGLAPAPDALSLSSSNKNNKGSTSVSQSLSFKLDIFRHLSVADAEETTLSLMYDKPPSAAQRDQPRNEYTIRPAEIKTFLVVLDPSTTPNNQQQQPPPVATTVPAPIPKSDESKNKNKNANNKDGEVTKPAAKDDDDLHEMLKLGNNDDNKNNNNDGQNNEDHEGVADETPITPLPLPHKDNDPFADQEEVPPANDDDTKLIIPVNNNNDDDNNNQNDNNNNNNNDITDDVEPPRPPPPKGIPGKIRPTIPAKPDTRPNDVKSSGEGRVGENDAQARRNRKKPQSVPITSTNTNASGLYTMSVMFYLGLLVLVVGGGCVCRRRNRKSASSTSSAGSQSRVPAVWKEREESMMKLL